MNDSVIDFVVTWVDGNDPKWQRERLAWDPDAGTDGSVIRYRDWGLMRYWFRGVEQFAPWVNKIHFITWGHVPEWLDVDNPKLNIVNHRDYMPEDCLPCFNSNAIELGMHKIKELSEHFVYFNDDMFLLKPVKPTDFFYNGIPVDSAVLSPVMPVWNEEIGKTLLNDMFLINKHFEKSRVIKSHRKVFFSLKYGRRLLRTLCLVPWRHFMGFYNDHLPIPYLKSTFDEVWEKEHELLNKTLHHRFRDYSGDISHWLMRYWQFCSGMTVPASKRRGECLKINSADTLNAIRQQKYKMICINDDEVLADSFETVQKDIQRAFAFLNKSCTFEL